MKMDKPLVTVVTPTFNRLDLLSKAIESVRNQTYSNIEHIIVGDSCPLLDVTENQKQLLEINPHIRINNLPTEQPKPEYGSSRIARVRNVGIELANGEFIAHLDDDNTWDVNHIESLLKAFSLSPEAGMVYSYRKLLIDGEKPYTFPYHPWSSDLETARRIYQAYRRMGIYQPNSHLMRDRATFHEEWDCTIDTNEMMLKSDMHKKFLFETNFSEQMIEMELGEDDVLSEQIYRAGYRIVASGEYSLNFRLGGRFTHEILKLIENSPRS